MIGLIPTTNYSVVPNRFPAFPYFRCNFLNFVPSDLMMMVTWSADVGARQDLVEGMLEMLRGLATQGYNKDNETSRILSKIKMVSAFVKRLTDQWFEYFNLTNLI